MAAFPPLPKHLNLVQHIETLARRVEAEYYVGWTADQIQTVDPEVRPNFPIVDIKTHISKAERLRLKKLAWAVRSQTPLACQFRQDVQNGVIKGIAAAKIEATRIWTQESDSYNAKMATKEFTADNPEGVNVKCSPTRDRTTIRKGWMLRSYRGKQHKMIPL